MSAGVSSANSHAPGVTQFVTASTTSVNNPNWSGYVAGSGSGNGFNETEGNWNVPAWVPSQREIMY